MPRARKQMDEIVALAEADQEFRAAVIANLESALRDRGYEVVPELLPALRERLSSS